MLNAPQHQAPPPAQAHHPSKRANSPTWTNAPLIGAENEPRTLTAGGPSSPGTLQAQSLLDLGGHHVGVHGGEGIEVDYLDALVGEQRAHELGLKLDLRGQ